MRAAIIQARMGSSRLPGKAMMEIGGIPSVWQVVARVKECSSIDMVIVAIPDTQDNDVLDEYLHGMGVSVFRGPEDDVLTRYYDCASIWGLHWIARITADCPLIDPTIIDGMMDLTAIYDHTEAIYIHNIKPRTYPDGLDVEIFSYRALHQAYHRTDDPWDREHVCHWMMAADACLSIPYYQSIDESRHRWTLDTKEDYEWFIKLNDVLPLIPPAPTTEDLISYLRDHPEMEHTDA